jgi:hypothetical protein
MHCPRCGQQQVSSDIRFCSRCGFALAGVTQLLASGGTAELQPAAQIESPRRKGVKQGALLIFIALAVAPILGMALAEVGGVMIGTLFLAGMLRMVYAALFQEGARRPLPPVPFHAPQQLPPPPRQELFPPAYAPPVDLPRERVNTAEIVQPPSVTENTTRHLEREREPRG